MGLFRKIFGPSMMELAEQEALAKKRLKTNNYEKYEAIRRKSECAFCGKNVNALTRFAFSDGLICGSCLSLCSKHITILKTDTADKIRKHIEYRRNNKIKFNNFVATDQVGQFLKINEENKEWINPYPFGRKDDNPDIFKFEDVIDYEFIEDGEVLYSKKGMGKAVIGGALFGGVGAVIGGSSSKSKNKNAISDMKIRISLKHEFARHTTLVFIDSEVKKGGFLHKTAKENAEKAMSLLDFMTKSIVAISQSANSADDIRKFKELFDEGIITQEEFDEKKRQLLGI